MADVFAKGTNGLIAIDGDVLTIDRTGFGGPGPRRIPLASITSVEWQPARVLTSGFIRFTVSDGPPDGVTFRRGQTRGFTMVRAAVEQWIGVQPGGGA